MSVDEKYILNRDNRKTKYVSAPKTWNGGTKHQKSWHAQRYGSKSM